MIMPRLFPSLCYALITVSVIACAKQPMAVVEDKGDKFYGWGALGEDISRGQESSYVTVHKGEGVYAIARKYQVMVQDLISLNHLPPPYHLVTGQRLRLPANKIHIVQPRETLHVVAERYRMTPEAIVSLNRLHAPYSLKVGQLLRIPANRIPTYDERNLAGVDVNTYQSVPIKGMIKKSDVVSTAQIPPAATSGVTPTAPRNFSAFASESPWRGVSRTDMPAATLLPPSQTADISKPIAPLPSTHVTDHTTYDRPDAEKSASLTVPNKAIEDADSVSMIGKSEFIWPVKGTVIAHFGPKKGGLQNDGINIAAPENSPVRAAAGGSVVYAGNELKGYGNLLIIRHSNGYLTAYAHQKQIVVRKGDMVKQGQVIGYIGATGNVTTPQLHFGLRQGKKAVDPEKFLPV